MGQPGGINRREPRDSHDYDQTRLTQLLAIRQRILVLDGAMGTMIQRFG